MSLLDSSTVWGAEWNRGSRDQQEREGRPRVESGHLPRAWIPTSIAAKEVGGDRVKGKSEERGPPPSVGSQLQSSGKHPFT